jgi:hypothetical protein
MQMQFQHLTQHLLLPIPDAAIADSGVDGIADLLLLMPM